MPSSANPDTDDPEAAPLELLEVARVLSPHGLRGEVKCRAITDFPERFKAGVKLYAGDPTSLTEYVVRSANVAGDLVYLRLRGITRRDAAAELQGAILQVRRADAVELPEGEFFWSDVIGLRVEDADGNLLGTVADILPTGANDVYVVRGERGEVLVPAVKDVVREIAPAEGRIVIDLLPGMLPEAPSQKSGAAQKRRGGFRRGLQRGRRPSGAPPAGPPEPSS